MIAVLRALMLAIVPLLAIAGGATAQPAVSSYTDIDLDQCTLATSDDFGSTWACPGYKGIPVMIAESDRRFFVSFGLTSTTERAADQTLEPANHLGEQLEWRIANVAGQFKPFATILRYFTQRETGDTEAQVLVITKIEPGATCHVAYIDALANPDASALARTTADELAPDFNCAGEPTIVGKFEAWSR